jgi:hypothetical protein
MTGGPPLPGRQETVSSSDETSKLIMQRVSPPQPPAIPRSSGQGCTAPKQKRPDLEKSSGAALKSRLRVCCSCRGEGRRCRLSPESGVFLSMVVEVAATEREAESEGGSVVVVAFRCRFRGRRADGKGVNGLTYLVWADRRETGSIVALRNDRRGHLTGRRMWSLAIGNSPVFRSTAAYCRHRI